MIFLSAQPDAFYFTWQLELQIFNFNSLGIPPENIHILLGYKPEIGLELHFEEIISKLKHKASFFTYPDNRIKTKYAPSIRPHLIRQHFLCFPELQSQTIFYHDSDIIFRELPDFDKMLLDNKWYVSDTRNYLDTNYIKMKGGAELFSKMCEIVGIQQEKVIAQDQHCGGAQYLLKNVSIEFWEKLEYDSERLYTYMKEFNAREIVFPSREKKQKGIQAWCADMWVILWNAVFYGKCVEIHNELDFCWADNSIDKWSATKILHYTGNVTKENLKTFRKLNYSEFVPFYDLDLNKINSNSCSGALADLIKEYTKTLEVKRIDLSDVLLIIVFDSDCYPSLEVLTLQLRYIEKFLKIKVHILEKGNKQLYTDIPGLKAFKSTFCKSGKANLSGTMLKRIAEYEEVDIITFFEVNMFLEVDQFVAGIKKARMDLATAIIPNNGTVLKIDRLFQSIFEKCLDPLLLQLNSGKFNNENRQGAICLCTKKDLLLRIKDDLIFDDIVNSVVKVIGTEIVFLNYPVYYFSSPKDYKKPDH